MKKLIGLLILLGISTSMIYAQNASDALRYSYINLGGSARSIGVGGAINAFGADYSSLSVNPAGVAAYRRSELIFTPSIFTNEVEARLKDNNLFVEDESQFHVQNVGFVFVQRPRRNPNWKTTNLAIGYNRLANFHEQIYFEGTTEGSITDRWVEQANNGIFDDFESNLALQTLAVYDPEEDGTYTSDFLQDPGHGVFKSQTIQTEGSLSEIILSFGGNYKDKIYLGATLGVPIVSYDQNKVYMEEDPGDNIEFFNDLTFEENVETSGVGINLKMGMMYRLTQMWRFGLAVHTPTAFSLSDNFSTELEYYYTDAQNDEPISEASPQGNFNYDLVTPWRFIASAGAIINKSGFISAELEWVDYSKNEFDLTGDGNNPDFADFERELNGEVRTLYQDALHVRFGGEYVYERFRFRGGIQLNGIPFSNDSGFDKVYSLGAGIRGDNVYLDLAYRWGKTGNTYYPYQTNEFMPQPVAESTMKSLFVGSIGVKF